LSSTPEEIQLPVSKLLQKNPLQQPLSVVHLLLLSMKNTIILIVALLLIGGGIYFVQSSQKKSQEKTPVAEPTKSEMMKKMPDTQTTPSSSGAMMKEDSPTATQEGVVKEFTVEGANFSFTPKTITVNKGDKVKITFKNKEGFHDLFIDAFKVATKKIGANQEDTVEFIADKTGKFEYYCSVGNHRQMGMVGTLTVK